MSVILPTTSAAQDASWRGLFYLAARVPDGWTLVGGQMVHLLCAERGVTPHRATPDVDTVLDVRRNPQILMTVTSTLEAAGFRSLGVTMGGKQHRWEREEAIIDVLIPQLTGRAATNKGAGGSPGLETPGAQYALNRSERVQVTVGSETGFVNRPTLIGAVVAKAAAYSVTVDIGRARHLGDLALLASMLTARDLRDIGLVKGEKRYLCPAVEAARTSVYADQIDGAADGLTRLQSLMS